MSRTPKVMVLSTLPQQAERRASLLRRRGCSVMVSVCGEEAVRDARVLLPDVFVIGAPVSDVCNRTFIGVLRDQRELSRIPIIVAAESEDEAQAAMHELHLESATLTSDAALSATVFRVLESSMTSAESLTGTADDRATKSTVGFMLQMDRNGVVLSINKESAADIGVNPADANGAPLASIFPREFSERLVAQLPVISASGRPVHMVSDDQRVAFDFLICPVYEDDGQIDRFAILGYDRSERIRTEHALRDVEQRYRQIIETANEGIWVVDENQRTTFVNSRLAQMLRCREQDLIGMSSLEFILTEDHARMRDVISQRREGRREIYEQRIRRKDGSICWMRISASPLYDAAGNYNGSFAMMTDITESREATEKLRRQDLFLRDAQRIGRLGSWEWSVGSELLTLSPALNVILGRDPNATVIHGIDEALGIVHPHDRERIQAAISGSLQSTCDIDTTFAILHPDGRNRVLHLRGETVRDPSGTLVACIGTAQDVTDRVVAEDALRLEKERAQMYLDIAGVMIVVLDLHGFIVLVNKRTQEILRRSPGELIGASWFELCIPARERHETETAFADIINGRLTVAEYHENAIVTSTGEERLIAWRNTLLRDEHGRIIGTLSSGEDITEHRRAEEALRRSNDELEERIRARTHALVEEIAERRRKEREIEDSRERLRLLSARLESIREDEKARISREIHDELGHLLTAAKLDLLSIMSRWCSGNDEMRRDTLELVGLVDTAIETTRRISSDLRPGILDHLGLVPAIEWQSHQFQQRTRIPCVLDLDEGIEGISQECATVVFRIYQEILTNIARHAEATHVTVSLQLVDHELLLRVEDNGKGIRHSDVIAPGSLGLLGIRERAHSIGGSVLIRGVPGTGTTVLLTVPHQ